jgi:hypothetical protein
MEELPVIQILYEVYKKLLELSATLDKKYRYSLGESTTRTCLEALDNAALAKHAPKPLKIDYIFQAEAKADLLSLQIRSILELKLANETNCLKLQAKLLEARRMLGGWRKSLPPIRK